MWKLTSWAFRKCFTCWGCDLFCSSNSEIKSCMHDPKFCKFHVCVCLDDVKWWHSEKRMACLKYRWGESAKNNGVRKVQMCLERKQLEIKGYKCQREHSNNFNYWKIFVWLLMPCGKEVFQHFGLIHDFVKYFLWVGCTFVKSSHMQSHPVCDSEKKVARNTLTQVTCELES